MKENKRINQNSEKDFLSARDRLYSEDGIDLSLIQWMLSLTPTERLQVLQKNIHSIMKLRGEETDS